jgi:hypothetical protein
MLTLEDGSGMSTSNSYADASEGDDYAAARLFSTDWTNASAGDKDTALMMATRVIEACTTWNGQLLTTTQALGWPRNYVIKSTRPVVGFGFGFSYGFYPYQMGAEFYDNASVPKGIKDATCELAILLLKSDRTADAPGKGIKSFGVGQNAVQVTFDPADARQIIPDVVYLLLMPFGAVTTGRGTRFIPTSRA